MERVKGRPESTEGRLEKEIRVYDYLDRLNIEYERIDHEVAMTMEACQEIDRALEATICKNLFLCNRQETSFYLLMMPGDKKFKTKELSKQIGTSRLSFAKDEYMLKYLDITPGSVSVMGLMNDKEKKVKLVMDEEVTKGEYIGCHPCINTSSIRLKTADLMNVILPDLGYEPVIVHLEGEAWKKWEERVKKDGDARKCGGRLHCAERGYHRGCEAGKGQQRLVSGGSAGRS